MADAPIRITTAGSSPQADLARRQRRYIISMTIRTLCFIGAVLAGLAGLNWLWPILILAAVVLPYVAVVNANAATTRTDSLPLPGGGRSDRQLGSGEH
jgi:fatty acid desaturase